MAAADVEIASLIQVRVDNVTGAVYTSDTAGRTIAQNLNFSTELRVMPDATISETAGYPTIKNYLKAMATRGNPHLPVLINQTMIVTTYKA